ncbi:MAG: hypothetical protein K0M45_12020 [Candidatus Paracaedibacteraceae bacterium]|nr:hypothetical protein [Candidatus Paracaedibacteraceae bacterium]
MNKSIHYALLLLGLASPSFSVDKTFLKAPYSGQSHEDVERGEAPSKLKHLPMILRNDAHAFYIRWEEMSSLLEDNPFAQYIKKIIVQDGIGIEVKKKAIQYRLEELDLP